MKKTPRVVYKTLDDHGCWCIPTSKDHHLVMFDYGLTSTSAAVISYVNSDDLKSWPDNSNPVPAFEPEVIDILQSFLVEVKKVIEARGKHIPPEAAMSVLANGLIEGKLTKDRFIKLCKEVRRG